MDIRRSADPHVLCFHALLLKRSSQIEKLRNSMASLEASAMRQEFELEALSLCSCFKHVCRICVGKFSQCCMPSPGRGFSPRRLRGWFLPLLGHDVLA